MPDAYEWPEDEIVDAPASAPAFLAPPPMPPMPQQRPAPLPVTPPPLLPPGAVAAPPMPQQHPAPLPPTPPPLLPPAAIAPPAPPPLLPPMAVAPPPRPPLEPKRSGVMPLVVIGTVAAAAVAVIAVAVVASSNGTPKPPAEVAGTPVASLPPVAPPSGPVSDIALADHGDNVVVTWAYPSGANGPVIVSAAPAGDPMRPMQSLPAGTDTYMLPGLDPQRDYCVTVSVAYSTDNLVMAPPVCTKRK